MNNRQKAKHFKRLYEMAGIKYEPPKVYKSNLRHYMARQAYDEKLQLSENEILDLAADHFSREIREVIRKNIELDNIKDRFQTEASLHVWFLK